MQNSLASAYRFKQRGVSFDSLTTIKSKNWHLLTQIGQLCSGLNTFAVQWVSVIYILLYPSLCDWQFCYIEQLIVHIFCLRVQCRFEQWGVSFDFFFIIFYEICKTDTSNTQNNLFWMVFYIVFSILCRIFRALKSKHPSSMHSTSFESIEWGSPKITCNYTLKGPLLYFK